MSDCASPPELSSKELWDYLDGRAGPMVRAHLKRCPSCRGRAKELAVFQDGLHMKLKRIACPSSLELGEYHLGILPSADAERIRQHVAGCPACQQEIDQLKGYLQETASDLEFGTAEKVKVILARLLPSGASRSRKKGLTLAPAGAGVRGERGGVSIYQAKTYRITIDIQKDSRHPESQVLVGLATGLPAAKWQAQLYLGDQLITGVHLDDLGNFSMAGVEPGHYHMVLTDLNMEIHIQDLEI